MSDDIIKKALGMGLESSREDNAIVPVEASYEEVTDASEDINKDIEFARENTIGLIAQSQEAIDELLLIAKQSQHPRAFEVVANLLKTSADLNSDLLNIHKKKQDLTGKVATAPSSAKNVTNNNLFVGSTADLQNMLADMAANNKKNEDGGTT